MSLTNVNMRMDYVGNGLTAVFPYTYRIIAATDLQVWKNIGTGGEVMLTYGVDYTVDGVGLDGGGAVTLTAGALANGIALAILRIVRDPLTEPVGLDDTQPMTIKNQGEYDPVVVENEADRGAMIDQSQQDSITRSLTLPRSEKGSKFLTTIPLLADRLGKMLGFDSVTGAPTAVSAAPISPLVLISAFYQTLLTTTPAGWLAAFLVAVTPDAGMAALGVTTFFRNLLVTTPAAFMQAFLVAADEATARTALGFGTGGIVEGTDLIDGSTPYSKMAFQVVNGWAVDLVVYDINVHSLLISATELGVREFIYSAISPLVDIEVNGPGGLEYDTPGGTNPSTEQASIFYSVWVIAKADGSDMSTLLSASLTDPNMPAGYTLKRRVALVYNDAGMDFDSMRMVDDWFTPSAPIASITGQPVANSWTAANVGSVSVPDIEMEIELSGSIRSTPNPAGECSLSVRPSGSMWTGGPTTAGAMMAADTGAKLGAGRAKVMMDASRQIEYYFATADNNGTSFTLSVIGFKLPRV